MSDAIVELDHVTVRFGTQTALEDITMRVEPRTFLALIGPNAGGKTTLLRTILGQVRPATGAVRVFGRPAAELGPLRSKIGYVPQLSVVNRRYPATAREVVQMGAVPQAGLLRRLPRDTDARVAAMLERVGLAEVADRDFHALSGGQQQRAIIARTLVPGPELLLLDEPTAAIDTSGQTQVLELLGELQHDLGLSIIIVTHYLTQLLATVDRVACLNRTLHWHDEAELLNESVLAEVYGCELDAFFVQHHAHQERFHGQPTSGGHAHG